MKGTSKIINVLTYINRDIPPPLSPLFKREVEKKIWFNNNVKYQDKFLKVLKEAKREKERDVEMKRKEKEIILFLLVDLIFELDRRVL